MRPEKHDTSFSDGSDGVKTRQEKRRATPGSKAFDDPGVLVELPLVNQIRRRGKAWRDAGYAGVTGITKRLLEHWRDAEERRNRRFFFCQLEAIETLIRLTTGKMLVLEVKGQDTQQHKTKREFLAKWVKAVNGHGGFGRWASDVSFDPVDIGAILQKHHDAS